jgi:hypothetical protein
MVFLNDEEYQTIETLVKSSTQSGRLQVELIDHTCTSIEFLMEQGLEFQMALNETLKHLAPEGFAKVQSETVNYLTLTQTFVMKKFMYLGGFFATIGILTGFLFKLMHWPGGGAIMFIGFISLLITMMFLLINLNKNRKQISSIQLAGSMIAAGSGILIAVGSIFKFLHYPGANVLFTIGMIILVFAVVPSYFWQLYKKDIISN